MSYKGKYLSVPPTVFGGIASIPQTNPNFGKTSKSMDPISLIALIGSAVASIAGAVGSNASINKQLKEQKNENASTRQYNLMLARLQNKWNIEQWQRENDYNSPTAQMARFRSAGLNPNLIYGQQNTSASSPTLTSGASASPQDMSPVGRKRNFGQAVQEMLNIEMQRAQIEAIKAGTEKTKEETRGIGIGNEWLPSLNKAELEQRLANVDLTKEQKKQVIETCNNLREQNNYLKANTAKVRAEIEKIGFDAFVETCRLALEEESIRLDVIKAFHQFGIEEAQLAIALKKLPQELALLYTQSRVNVANANATNVNEILRVSELFNSLGLKGAAVENLKLLSDFGYDTSSLPEDGQGLLSASENLWPIVSVLGDLALS